MRQQNGQTGVEQEHNKITTATQDRAVSLGALDSTSKLEIEERGNGKISAHDKTKQEKDSEVLVAGPRFAVDWKPNDTTQNESLTKNSKTKLTEKDSQDQVGPEKEEMGNEYVEMPKDSAWNRDKDDIEPTSTNSRRGVETAKQPEFQETSL